MSTSPRLPAALLLVALGAAACSSGGASTTSTAASGSPVTPTAVPSPPFEGIVHPTGADEIVLRYEDVGGFTPPEWQAARLPYFTLYGDGRVVFIQTSAEVPVREDNVSVGMPLRTAMLSEEQVQSLLQYALTDGGLAIAKAEYQNPMVADVPTAVFTINAEDAGKTVSVTGLGMEGQPGVDSPVLARLAKLGERLRDFDQGGAIASAPYVADSYRGVLLETQGAQGIQVRPWPWVDLQPDDFALPADPNALPQRTRLLTPDEVAAVGVDGYQNGFASGVWLRGPDGLVYSLTARPILPDERA